MLKKRILSIVLVLTMLMVPGAYAAQPAKDNMRGVWVASVHNIDFPSEQGMTADQLKAEADTELDNIAAMGLNTVFLQVPPMRCIRPSCFRGAAMSAARPVRHRTAALTSSATG